jgi:hypothetical protein
VTVRLRYRAPTMGCCVMAEGLRTHAMGESIRNDLLADCFRGGLVSCPRNAGMHSCGLHICMECLSARGTVTRRYVITPAEDAACACIAHRSGLGHRPRTFARYACIHVRHVDCE